MLPIHEEEEVDKLQNHPVLGHIQQLAAGGEQQQGQGGQLVGAVLGEAGTVDTGLLQTVG